MEVKFTSVLKNAIPLCFLSDGKLLISKSNLLYLYDTTEHTHQLIIKLPISFFKKLLNNNKLTSRVLRLGVRYAVPIDDDRVLVIFNHIFYELNIKDRSYVENFKITRGNRPLNIASIKNLKGFSDSLCFGEYFFNPDKGPIHIYKMESGEKDWKIVYTFETGNIDHVHAIIPDQYRDCVWILTGDFDNGAAIWMAKNNFKEVRPILRGDQIYRACVAFPFEEGLVYATDSQFETNSIRLLKLNARQEWESSLICEINGPSIYGCMVNNDMFFSTSVEGNSLPKGKFLRYLDREPAPGVKSNYAHIVAGNLKTGFNIVYKNEKDWYPFMIFQFGAITFPTGINQSDFLYTYNRSLKKNGFDTEIFKLKE